MAVKKTKALTLAEKQKDIKSILVSPGMKNQFAAALPKHLSPDRFIRIALTAMIKTPKLRLCTRESLFECLLDLSQLGLEPDGRKAHLVPYGNKCTLIIDYKGLVELARRSGELSDIHADIVKENDSFEYAYGSNSYLKHHPCLADRGKVVAAYSFVKLKDGEQSFEVMSLVEIERIRSKSPAAKSGPWVTDWDEMAKKTVFRRHSKWLPVSSEKYQEALDKDNDLPIKPLIMGDIEDLDMIEGDNGNGPDPLQDQVTPPADNPEEKKEESLPGLAPGDPAEHSKVEHKLGD